MRLATLNPKLTHSPYATAYTHQLSFDCPRCGKPFLISANLIIGPPPGTQGVWGLTLPSEPSGDGWDGVTVTPSIQNNNHGPKKACGFHCSIINGEVLP